MIKYNQKVFDTMMCLSEGVGVDCFYDDLIKLKGMIEDKFNIEVSPKNALEFWLWRSQLWDAQFLTIFDEEEVSEWFIKWLEFKEYDEVEELMIEEGLL